MFRSCDSFGCQQGLKIIRFFQRSFSLLALFSPFLLIVMIDSSVDVAAVTAGLKVVQTHIKGQTKEKQVIYCTNASHISQTVFALFVCTVLPSSQGFSKMVGCVDVQFSLLGWVWMYLLRTTSFSWVQTDCCLRKNYKCFGNGNNTISNNSSLIFFCKIIS